LMDENKRRMFALGYRLRALESQVQAFDSKLYSFVDEFEGRGKGSQIARQLSFKSHKSSLNPLLNVAASNTC